MTDEILIHGAVETAEVIGEDSQEFECSCGFKLQLSGGIALNDKFKVVASTEKEYTCPICKGSIAITEKA
jgi:hypothetical protein